jgi:hypothetical protein
MSFRFKRSIGRIAVLSSLSIFAINNALAQQGCDFDVVWPAPSPVNFDRDVQPIFDARCVSCHRPGGEGFAATGLDLRPGQSQRHLVGRPSAQEPQWLLVTPFEPDVRSLLWHKIRCDQPPIGARMPKGLPRLSIQEQIDLYSWMFRGAPPGRDGSGRDLAIQFGMTGSWYDPSASGQGFSFEVVPHDPPLFLAYWLTYAREDAFLAERQQGLELRARHLQRWMVASGNYQRGDAKVSLDVQFVAGGFFDVPDNPTSRSIGTAMLMFHSCTEATLHYDIAFENDEAQRVERSVALRRLTPNVACEEELAED